MLPRKYAYHYSRNIKLAVIASLAAVILLFKFMPRISVEKEIHSDQNEIIYLNEIPATFQDEKPGGGPPPKPREPVVLLEGEVSESPPLPDVEISSNSVSNNNASLQPGNGSGEGVSGHFVPRQILEVVPVKPDNDVTGTIRLSLKIGTDGKVAGYKILFNNTDCPECLKNVITAAMKSKWQPAVEGGIKVEYWIEKSYAFN